MNDMYLVRGKRISNCPEINGKWVQGHLTVYKNCPDDTICIAEYAHDLITVDRTTIGQNTARKDMHNNTIYESDIVKVFGKIGVVEFNFGGWTVKTICGGHIRWGNREDLWEFDPADIEIIGNVHDNPEMLAGGYAK